MDEGYIWVPHRCCRVRPCRVTAETPQDGACEIQVCVLSSPLKYPFRTCRSPHTPPSRPARPTLACFNAVVKAVYKNVPAL